MRKGTGSEPIIRWHTEEEAVAAATLDAASGNPNPDDPRAVPAFAGRVVGIIGEMQSRLGTEYSNEINPLDEQACNYARMLADDRTTKTRQWERRFASHIHSSVFYWVALILVFTADVAINAYVFQSWGDSDDMSLFIAIIVGAALLLIAKFTAWSLRSGPSVLARTLGGAFLVLPIVILWLISVTRYDAMAAEGRTVGNSVELYFALNILFFGVGFLMSFFKETNLEKLDKKLEQSTQARQRVFETYSSKALTVLHQGAWLIDMYRETNDRAQGQICAWLNPHAYFPKVLTKLHEADAGAQDMQTMIAVDLAGQPISDVAQ